MICPQYSPSVSKQEESIRHKILCARICTCLSGHRSRRYAVLVGSLSSIAGGDSEIYRLLLKNIYSQLIHFEMVLPNVEEIPGLGYSKEMTAHTILFDTESNIPIIDTWWHEAQMKAEKTREFLGAYPESILIVHGLVKKTLEIKPDKEYIKYYNSLPKYEGIRGGTYCQTCRKGCKPKLL